MTEKTPNFVAVNCRIPRELHDQLLKITEVTQKSSAQIVGTSLEAYIRWLRNEDFVNKNMKVDKYALELDK